MKIIFMGTPDFAVPCLEELIALNHEIVGVFTQPDKKKGRGYTLTAPPVKELALKHNLPVYQPITLKTDDSIDLINSLKPDLIVVVAYGKILPESILKIPNKGCINVHGSLLPKYRGAAPIQWSVINGEKVTGITTMYMDAGLDTGDMILKSETTIDEDETSGELYDRLKIMGAKLLVETINQLEKGIITREQQDNNQSSYAPMLDKSLSNIDWNLRAEAIHNLVRGLNPWPVAMTTLESKNLKIYRTKVSNQVVSLKPGEVKSISPFIVCCGENTAIEILELQLESKKRMNADDFLRGYKLKEGTILGG